MTKEFKNLQSEQLLHDGSWHWSRLVNEANDRLTKIGKHGKRAKIKVTPKPGKPISTQFSLPGIGQKSYGLNLQLNKNNLIKAEEICSLITGQLVAGTFTEDWFYSVVGKENKVSNSEKFLTCGEMLEQYKAYYFKQKKETKNPRANWKANYRYLENTLSKYNKEVIHLKIVKEVIECTENNTPTRRATLNGLASFLSYFDNKEFKQLVKRYKKENNPKSKNKYVPTDSRIVKVYNTGFEPKKRCSKRWLYRYPQWQFLYGLLAVYGLRIHEAWNIKNWNKPVTLKAGEWIAIADLKDTKNESEQGNYNYTQMENDKIIPAILDPKNEDYLLCIGHETKTGYRVAIPISPNGIGRNCNWIKDFNLLQPMNLPDIKDPLGKMYDDATSYNCTFKTNAWFNPPTNYRRNKLNNTPNLSTLRYGFTAHALRHAYNIRAHKLGVTPKIIANSLGHGMRMNLTTYTKYEQLNSKVDGFKQEFERQTNKKSFEQKLQEQIAYLKDENKYLKAENEKLRTKLAMYEAIEQSKSS